MANYYMQDGRYFGEDSSFYEFDADCLKQKGDRWKMDESTQEPECEKAGSRVRTKGNPQEAAYTDPDENTSNHECEACSPDADPKENHPDPPADFDRLFTNRKLDMLKTAVPFLPPRQQKTFACAVKLVEFRNLVGYFGQPQQTSLGACSDEDPQMRLADMLDAVRGYCSPAEQEQIDSLFQVLMTVQMMR